ncbi:MAG TPA: hypothetical protein VI457_06490 [Methylococcaceae bacterium]|nr:hypothetical protein [Methylococcaceae bacterium]
MNIVLFGIVVYVSCQLLIGVLMTRRVKTEADYLLAGLGLENTKGTDLF